ncbi:hypothetical protein [Deinococcus sp.]|uniref:hypothetical protein n=1 Tax=Deinococcus sp. TaxID=47478 RepID=UPI003C7A6F50
MVNLEEERKFYYDLLGVEAIWIGGVEYDNALISLSNSGAFFMLWDGGGRRMGESLDGFIDTVTGRVDSQPL